jgi:hypothetical protein
VINLQAQFTYVSTLKNCQEENAIISVWLKKAGEDREYAEKG